MKYNKEVERLMKKPKYEFSDGSSHHNGVTAQQLGEYLEEIRRDSGGALTPEQVLEAAKSRNSLIHDMFEWDDKVAGQEHRKWQARQLIGSVQVAYRISDDRPSETVRAFVNIRSSSDRYYTSTVEAMGDEAKRQMLLEQAFKELEAVRKRYQTLVEFSEVFTAIRKAGRKIKQQVQHEARP